MRQRSHRRPPGPGRISLSVVASLCAALGVAAPHASAQDPDVKQVALVIGNYPDSPAAFQEDSDAETWADALEPFIAEYYMRATGGRTTIDIVPIPGTLEFDYRYEDTAPGQSANPIPRIEGSHWFEDERDDPMVVFREMPDAVQFCEDQIPGIFDSVDHVVLLTNRYKRGRATGGNNPFLLDSGELVLCGATLIPRAHGDAVLRVEDLPETFEDLLDLNLGNSRRRLFSVICHEIGHMLDLPDLYQLSEFPDLPPCVECWGCMAWDSLQHFSPFSRLQNGWYHPIEIRRETLGFDPIEPVTVHLHPPHSETPGYEVLLVEFDSEIGLDTDIPLTTFAVEVRSLEDIDAPVADKAGYDPGVVIYRHYSLFRRPISSALRPAQVLPSQASGGDYRLEDAAFELGDTVELDLGARIEVIQEYADGSAMVRLTYDGYEAPDIMVSDLALDSPFNGFAIQGFPPTADQNATRLLLPPLCGDPVTTVTSITWDTSGLIPVPVVNSSVPQHRVIVAVKNVGNRAASDVRGTLYVVDGGTLVMDLAQLDIFDPSSWPSSFSAMTSFPVEFGTIAEQQEVVQRVTISPTGGPMTAFFVVNPPEGEAIVHMDNNAKFEFFALPWIVPGSPYGAVDVDIEVTTMSTQPHVYTILPLDGDPSPWPEFKVTASSTGEAYSLLTDREPTDSFHIHAYGIEPEPRKPGGVEVLDLGIFMNLGCTMVPAGELSIPVILAKRPELTLEADGGDGKWNLTGRLTVYGGQATEPQPGKTIAILVSGSDGSAVTLNAETNGAGNFLASFDGNQGVRYAAVASFVGDLEVAPAESELVSLDTPAAPAPPLAIGVSDLTIHRHPRPTRTAQFQGVVTLDRVAPRGGVVVRLAASARGVGIPRSVTVAERQREARFDIAYQGVSTRGVTISASVGESSATAALAGAGRITPPDRLPVMPSISDFQVERRRVGRGTQLVGTITLDRAVTSDTEITVSSSNGRVLRVPATVTIPRNGRTVEFTVQPTGIAVRPGTVTITVTMGDSRRTAEIAVGGR